jgi:hypothetical protein
MISTAYTSRRHLFARHLLSISSLLFLLKSEQKHAPDNTTTQNTSAYKYRETRNVTGKRMQCLNPSLSQQPLSTTEVHLFQANQLQALQVTA